MYRTSFLASLAMLAALLLAGCETSKKTIDKISSIDLPSPIYKLEIVQGNFVSAEQVAALRTGMPRAQVKNILGTPLLTDIFHADRWDYVFTILRDGKPSKPQRLTVFFKDDVLDRHEGDAMPSENDFVKTLSSGRKVEKAPPLVASEKDLADFAKRENPTPKTAAPSNTDKPSSVGAAPLFEKIYPPLESK